MNKYNQQIESLKQESAETESDLKAMGIQNKITRLKKLGDFEEYVLLILKDKYSVVEFAANSYRIANEDKTVDFYPPSGSLFIHKTKKWLKGVKNNDNIIKTIEKHLICKKHPH